MENIKDFIVSPQTTIKDALEKLNNTACQILFTTNEYGKVLGTITDGDLRRAFLRGENIECSVEKVANKSFVSAKAGISDSKTLKLLRKNGVRQIPLLDEEGRLVGVRKLENLINAKLGIDNPVVIMAGGKGTRLLPITENLPKPLLKVGDQSIIERLILSLKAQGTSKFFITVNYLAEKIIEHLGNGEKFDCEINYVCEPRELGTAGGLSLLHGKINSDFLVLNGDVITSVDIRLLTQFHEEHKAAATICAKNFSIGIPYGVLRIDGFNFLNIDEKPQLSILVNSGIYCFSPVVFEFLKEGHAMQMPALLTEMNAKYQKVRCFQSVEPWIDIGSHEDFRKAQQYSEHFTK